MWAVLAFCHRLAAVLARCHRALPLCRWYVVYEAPAREGKLAVSPLHLKHNWPGTTDELGHSGEETFGSKVHW